MSFMAQRGCQQSERVIRYKATSFSETHLYLELLDQMIQIAARKQKQNSLMQTPLASLVRDENHDPLHSAESA